MPSLMIIIIAISILSLPIQSHQRKLTGLHQHYERKKRARWKKLRKYDPSLPLSWYTINNKPDIKDNKKKNSNMNKSNDTDPDHIDSDDMNNNDKREINCDTFIGNGGIYAVLESYAGVLLRGMNLMSSDDIDKQNQGIQLYQDQLYPIMSDSFTWENLDGGTVISNKQELIDNALTLGMK